MKIKSWPSPPIFSGEPPLIPDTFKTFGLEYKNQDGRISLNISSKKLSISHMRECIDKSFDLFISILKTFDSALINKITQLHTHINEEINLAKNYELENLIVENKNMKIRAKTEILERIRSIMDK